MEDHNPNNTPTYKAEILAISAASCHERFVRLTMRLNPNTFEITEILIPFHQAKDRLQTDLTGILERMSRGEENERFYHEAMKAIEAADLNSPDVVAKTNEVISVFGERGQMAMYAALFSDDSSTRLLAMNCIIVDHENYREYLPFLGELDHHDDEAVRRLLPKLLELFEG